MMKYYIKALKNFATFNGRARRQEYWYFFLFNMVFSLLIGLVGAFTGVLLLGNVYSLLMFLPGLAVAVRRVHDVGKSGWLLLIPFYNLVLLFTEGDKGSNKYGPDPKPFCLNCNTYNNEGEIVCVKCGGHLNGEQINEIETQNSVENENSKQTIFYLSLIIITHYFIEFSWFVLEKFIVPIWFKSYDGTLNYEAYELYEKFWWTANIFILSLLMIFAFLLKNNLARIVLFILFSLKLLMIIGYRFSFFYDLIFN